MQGKKTSSEDIVNVITAKLSNPDLSLRDLEKETWVNYRTNKDILDNNLPEVLTNSNKAKTLFDYNLDIINEWARKIAEAMKILNPVDIKDTKEYQTIVDTSFKQNQLMWVLWNKDKDQVVVITM